MGFTNSVGSYDGKSQFNNDNVASMMRSINAQMKALSSSLSGMAHSKDDLTKCVRVKQTLIELTDKQIDLAGQQGDDSLVSALQKERAELVKELQRAQDDLSKQENVFASNAEVNNQKLSENSIWHNDTV